MKALDPGHRYELACLDLGAPGTIQFVKRIGYGYPGNTGNPCPGTNCQEVLRALIDRCLYLNGQIPCAETEVAIALMKAALLQFEVRAKRVKGKTLTVSLDEVIAGPICRVCGHVQCSESHAG